jgi:pilus assembly protein Flp/PilA
MLVCLEAKRATGTSSHCRSLHKFFKGKTIMTKFITKFAQDESGATAIEYGLIAALIAVAVIAALNTLSGKITGTFNKVGNAMPQ